MDIRQGTIWYDTEEEQYVEVASISAHIPHVDSHASGLCISSDQIRISVGPFDGYGPTPWNRRDCYIEQFERRYEPTDLRPLRRRVAWPEELRSSNLTREEAINLGAEE